MINGILNIYKEKGYTSHDAVAKLRGILKQKKIGHTGTLDPNALGVLPVCLGKATKLCDLLTDKDKIYEAVLLLGVETDTQDMDGTVLREVNLNAPENQGVKENVKETIASFVGRYDQIPPMYSALKVNGKKLYELAREGIEIERKSRPVEIKSIEILETAIPRIRMRVHCSKGTYIRTLCHDIGTRLGCGGCMEELVRIKVERFSIEKSLTLSQIETLVREDRLEKEIISIEEMFSGYPKAVVKEEFSKRLYNGNILEKQHFNEILGEHYNTWIRIYDSNQIFTGLYKFDNIKQVFKNVKMFLD